MSAIELREQAPIRVARYDFLATLHAGWRAMLAHREERRMIVKVSRLPARIIRDMGFDPELVYEALDGSWDEVDPAGYRPYMPRTEHV